jgi:hypothetical protein
VQRRNARKTEARNLKNGMKYRASVKFIGNIQTIYSSYDDEKPPVKKKKRRGVSSRKYMWTIQSIQKVFFVFSP